MRIALSASLAPLMGRREVATLSSSFGLTFTGKTSDVASQLKAAFRCARPGNRIVSGSPDIRVASHGHAGLLSLQSYQRLAGAAVHSSVPMPGPSREALPVREMEATLRPRCELPSIAPLSSALQQIEDIVQRARHEGAKWAEQEQSQFLGRDGRRWQDRISDAFTARRQHALRLGLLHRAEAMQALHQGLDELQQIKDAADAQVHNKALYQALLGARRQLLHQVLELAHPGLKIPLGDGGHPAMQRLGRALSGLDDKLRMAGGTVGQLSRVLEVLAGFGKTAEFLDTPQADARARGVQGLTAVIETVLEATTWPHDGAALNGLLGLDNAIDSLIVTLRRQALAGFLLQAAASRHGVRVDELEGDTSESCQKVAAEIARQDAELAVARQRLRVALQKAGVPFTMSGLNGIRVDASLVAALRAGQRKNPEVPGASFWGLGKKAPEVGVIVAGLMALERSAQSSPARNKLREAIVQMMDDVRPQCSHAQARAGKYFKLLEKARHDLASLTASSGQTQAAGAQSPDELADYQEKVAKARRDLDHFSRAFSRSTAVSNQLRVLQARLDSLAVAHEQRHHDVAQTGGLTGKELTQLGLSEEEAARSLDGVRHLMDQGVSSARQAANAAHAVSRIFDRLGSWSYLGDGGLMKVFLQGGSNEHRAQLFADVLARQLTGQMDVRRGADLPARLAAGFGDRFQARMGELLSVTQERYLAAEQRLLSLAADLQALQAESLKHEASLATFNAGRRTPLRMTDPTVVAAASHLQQAYRLLRNATDIDSLSGDERAQLHAHCRQLRGFKAETMSVPKLPWTASPMPDIALFEYLKKPGIAAAIDSICFLAGPARQRRATLESQTNATLLAMDQLLRERALELGQHSLQLRDLMRLAVLSTLQIAHQSGAATVADFSPAEHAGEISAWLTAAGVDTRLFEPELRRFLAESFGHEELNLWAQSTLCTKDYARALEQAWAAESAAIRQADERGGLKPATKAALLRQLDELSVGACMELTLRASLELETPYVPLVPGVGVIATGSGGTLSIVEIFRGADVYELLIRHGGEANLGVGVRVGLSGATEIGAVLDGTTDVGAGLYVVPGVSLRFAGDGAGLAQLKQFLEKAMTQKTITAMDLANVEQIIPVVETKLRGSASVGLRATVDPFGKKTSWSADVPVPDEAPYPRFRAHAGVDGNIGYMWGDYGNTSKTIFKREKDMTVSLSSSAAVNARIAIPGATDQVTGTHIAHLGAAASIYYRRKHAEVRGADRLLQPATNFAREMYPPPVMGRAAILTMGGALLRSVLEDRRLDPALKQSVDALIDAAGTSDKIRVVYALDESARGHINRLLSKARALREGRTHSLGQAVANREAGAFEAEAKALIDDDDNYYPVKLMLMPVNSRRHQLSLLNLGFVHWTTLTDSYTDHVAFEVKLDPAVVQAVRTEAAQNAQWLRQQ